MIYSELHNTYTWGIKFNGFSTPPDMCIGYSTLGDYCRISMFGNKWGISNSTDLWFSLPFIATETTVGTVWGSVDNGVFHGDNCTILVCEGFNVCKAKLMKSNFWTVSGNKGLIIKEFTYKFR